MKPQLGHDDSADQQWNSYIRDKNVIFATAS